MVEGLVFLHFGVLLVVMVCREVVLQKHVCRPDHSYVLVQIFVVGHRVAIVEWSRWREEIARPTAREIEEISLVVLCQGLSTTAGTRAPEVVS